MRVCCCSNAASQLEFSVVTSDVFYLGTGPNPSVSRILPHVPLFAYKCTKHGILSFSSDDLLEVEQVPYHQSFV